MPINNTPQSHTSSPSLLTSVLKMASFSTSLSPILILILSLILIFVSPSCSLPRRILDHQIGFKLSLTHIDSGKNLTKLERVQHAMIRNKLRLQKFKSMVSSSPSDLKSPVSPGNGEFLMSISIGTPALPFSAIMDTGSDLIWTQCKPCGNCYSQPTPIFDPKKSSTYKKLACTSDLCQALPQSSCDNGCEYIYQYGDSSSTQGVMAIENFGFESGSVSKIAFGCGEDNDGGGFGQGAGLVGLGRGPLSLVSQLKQPKFSYCLTSIADNKTSTLLMGSLANVPSSNDEVKTTPLVKNELMPSFYYLTLEGITVGETQLPIKKSTFAINEDGSGGMIIDSGTTITYLEKAAFELVKKAFVSQTKLTVDDSGSTGLDLCFNLPENTKQIEVPKLIFHFQGADLELPSDNYIIVDSSTGLLCLAMGGSSGMSIFGNIQQQNIMVVHDLTSETMSFIPTQCDQI